MQSRISNRAAARSRAGRLYALGGMTADGRVGTVEVYDVHTDTWERRADMPTPRWELAAGAGYAG